MNATDLRASILQAAIEGKLVPQLESEPEVEQIGEVSEEVPFEIPNKWKWTTLGEMGKWQAGGTPARSNLNFFRRGNIPWLKTGDLNDSEIKEVAEYITEEAIKNSSAHVNPIGSVLMAMYGATIGKLGILTFPCATNQACCACVVNENFVDKWYLFFYLLSQRTKFIALGAGGAQPNISRKKIVGYLIPLPPLAEQRRIVARLNELLPLVDDFGEAQEAFEVAQTEFPGKLKDSLLQVAIEGKLVPQLESEPEVEQIGDAPEEVPFEIPKKWKWVQLKTIFAKRSTINPVDYGESKVELWSIPAFDNGKPAVVPARQIGSSKKVVVEGDVLLSKIVPHIKRAWVVSETNGYERLASTEWIVFHSNDFLPNFLTMALTEPHFHSSLISTISGMGSLKRANPKKVGELYIPCPSLAEQRRIVDKLKTCLKQIEKLQQE